jgi:hypothetical protein
LDLHQAELRHQYLVCLPPIRALTDARSIFTAVIASIFSGVAAFATVIAVYFARETVLEARHNRAEEAAAHRDAMASEESPVRSSAQSSASRSLRTSEGHRYRNSRRRPSMAAWLAPRSTKSKPKPHER